MKKHRVSIESSKDSFSSWSPSSPFSYVDFNIDNHQHILHRGVLKGAMSPKTIMEKDSNNWYCDEPRQLSRSKSCQFKDGFSFSIEKDYPRFSYDGRETHNSNPRLSLDSRERSIRTLNSVSLVPNKQSNVSRNPKTNLTVNTRPPSVVAKLMGLETYPLSKPLNSYDENESTIKTPNSTRSTLKPISRVPIEAAPWKQRGPVTNVYSEVDKRIKNLEFGESGKDLRALKQILEAMHAVEVRSTDRSDRQNALCESRVKYGKKGFMNNKTGKLVVTERTRGERRSRLPVTDAIKPRKQSNKQPLESRTRRQNSSLISEKSTLLVKVSEQLTPEHPSPVSVLDDSVYVDNSPSHVKHTSITKKDDTPNPANKIASNTIISFHITREKLKKVANLVEKLNNVNSNNNQPFTDYITTLCENTNPNNTYISQMFLASGLLFTDLNSFNFHPSGYPINPDLFSVLEHTKFSDVQKGKVHRKLIFDVVNEFIGRKLSSDSRMMMIMQDPRKLLRELCLEIEQLQVKKKQDGCGPEEEEEDGLKNILLEDLVKRSENWNGFYGGSVMIGMEVEQLIFRDLVNEIVYKL